MLIFIKNELLLWWLCGKNRKCRYMIDDGWQHFFALNFATLQFEWGKSIQASIKDEYPHTAFSGVVIVAYTSGVGCLCCLFIQTGSEGLERRVSWYRYPRFFYEFARKYGFVGATSCSLLRFPLGHTRGRKQMYCLGRIYLQYRLSCHQRFSLSTRKEDSQCSPRT